MVKKGIQDKKMAKMKRDAIAISQHPGVLKQDISDFLEKKKERIKNSSLKLDPIENGIERMKAKDPIFRATIEAMEAHWLEQANTILSELMTAVRLKATDEKTTLSELSKAIDIISNKYNLSMGNPTSASVIVHKSQSVKDKEDEELDKEILELRKYIDYEPIEDVKVEP